MDYYHLQVERKRKVLHFDLLSQLGATANTGKPHAVRAGQAKDVMSKDLKTRRDESNKRSRYRWI